MDLTTSWLGLQLPHPFVAGASPLADTVSRARQIEDAGAAALVLRSLFEEQIRAEAMATLEARAPHENSFAEAATYAPEPADCLFGPDEYLDHLRRVKEALSIPVVGSLNGHTPGGWLEYATAIEQAGADAIELNLYDVVTHPALSSERIETEAASMVEAVRKAVSIPVAVKLSPFYTGMVHFTRALEAAGADGLVLFNRFFEPDIDLEDLDFEGRLQLSTSTELGLRLRWLAILSSRLRVSLAVTGGVHCALDAVKAIMAGASCVQLVSVLLQQGAQHLERIRQGMVSWMEEHAYASLEQMRGSMNLDRCPDPRALSRGNYIRMLQTFEMG